MFFQAFFKLTGWLKKEQITEIIFWRHYLIYKFKMEDPNVRLSISTYIYFISLAPFVK